MAASTTSSGLFGSRTVTERQERVWAVESEELGQLGEELILIHPEGYERLWKTPYYAPPEPPLWSRWGR